MKALLILTTAMLFSINAGAEIYKWVDENGETHYGTKPPAASTAEKMNVNSSRSSTAATKKLSPEAQETADAMAEALLENKGNAASMDCAKAVRNGVDGVDTMLEVGRKNYKGGYITKAEFDNTASSLKKIKGRMSIGECQSASGKTRDFYLCLSNSANHVASCGQSSGYGT